MGTAYRRGDRLKIPFPSIAVPAAAGVVVVVPAASVVPAAESVQGVAFPVVAVPL